MGVGKHERNEARLDELNHRPAEAGRLNSRLQARLSEREERRPSRWCGGPPLRPPRRPSARNCRVSGSATARAKPSPRQVPSAFTVGWASTIQPTAPRCSLRLGPASKRAKGRPCPSGLAASKASKGSARARRRTASKRAKTSRVDFARFARLLATQRSEMKLRRWRGPFVEADAGTPDLEKVSGTFVDPPSADHVFSANWDDHFAPLRAAWIYHSVERANVRSQSTRTRPISLL
jgi:hypothetical protein